MYLVGAPHPNKDHALAALNRLVADERELVTDAEVFQEILHRYTANGRPEAIEPAFDFLIQTTTNLFPIDLNAILEAKAVMVEAPYLSARDAIHATTMRLHGVRYILTFDEEFRKFSGLNVVAR